MVGSKALLIKDINTAKSRSRLNDRRVEKRGYSRVNREGLSSSTSQEAMGVKKPIAECYRLLTTTNGKPV